MRSLLAAALLLPAVPAIPQTANDYPQTLEYAGMPPPRLRASIPQVIRIVFGHLEDCGRPNIPGDPNAHFAACIRYGGVAYLPNPCDYGDREEFARLMCHEQAHFAGWPKDHGA
jgi:hypothetical protein